MLIDCDTCEARPAACDGCVMSVLLRAADGPDTGLDATEQAAVAALAGSGLVAPLRMVPLRRASGQ